MHNHDTTLNDTLAYRTHIENNMQYINEVHKQIETLILRLEKNRIPVKDCFVQLENSINLLIKVYQHFTSLGSYRYCLQLKSLVQHYQHIDNTQVQLSALYYVHSKMLALHEEQLQHFPAIPCKQPLHKELSHTKKTINDNTGHAFKWITFMRNTMWFIVLFDSYAVYSIWELPNIQSLSNNYYSAVIDNTHITVRDPLCLHEQPSNSILCVTHNGTTYGYFYDIIGKKIGARTNVIAQMAAAVQTNELYLYGRVRMFGKNLMYLKHIAI